MKRCAVLLFIVLVGSDLTFGQSSKKALDKSAIKEMCGCFEVTFNFAETFNFSSDSLYKPSNIKVAKGLEWAQLVTDQDDNIVIQHILQVGNPAKPSIVKHWRQDWIYENTAFYMYNGDNEWNFVNLSKDEVKGQWTQKVYQVDDSPRYEGSATWIHADGKSYWENKTDAPLPRREYTKRSDYNVTARGNRHEITSYGWLHDQDNDKIIREKGNDDIILAKEKGYNTYVKVPNNRCQAAQDWWVANTSKWELVRAQWEEVFDRNKDLSLLEKVDNKPLFKHLFSDDYNTEEEIAKIIQAFIIENKNGSM